MVLAPDLFDADGSYDANTTPQFGLVAALNQQVEFLGKTISLLRRTDVRYVPANALLQPDDSTDWSAQAGNDPYITAIASAANLHEFVVGFFEDDCGDIYVMLQNAMHSKGNFPTVLDQTETIRVDFDFSGASIDTTALDVLDHHTSSIQQVSLTSSGPSTAYVEFTLEPGDVVLYKYRTGRPFVRRP